MRDDRTQDSKINLMKKTDLNGMSGVIKYDPRYSMDHLAGPRGSNMSITETEVEKK